MAFSWLLKMTATTVWPFYVVALAALAAVATHRRGSPPPADAPVLRWLLLVLAAPLLILVWAAIRYGAESRAVPHHGSWSSNVLLALAVCILAAAVGAAWRARRIWYAALPCLVAVIAATAAATFIGGMAIVDDWI